MPNPIIDQITLPSGGTYDICDSTARATIAGSITIRGGSATPLSDGSTTNPINIAVVTTEEPEDWDTNYTDYYIYDSTTNTYSHPAAGSSPEWEADKYYEFVSRNCVANDAVFYGNKEFIFDGTQWHEFGDMSGLGALAVKDSVSASYVPAGSVSQPTFSGSSLSSTGSYTPTGSVSAPTVTLNAGTMPTFSVSGTTLTITGGTAPSITNVSAPEFTGTAATITVSGTPEGTVSQPTFTGTTATITST